MSAEIASLVERLDRLEAESACRACLSEYMDICDRLDATTDTDALGALFTRKAIWGGAGDRYAADFGSHHGRDAIVNWLSGFCTTPPHFSMNAHFLSSEAMTHTGQGSVSGRWLMLQTPTFQTGQSFVMAARLSVDFILEDDAWRMDRFSTLNLFARETRHWDSTVQIPSPLAQ